jgi:predicted nucleic acid-binding protein
VTRFLLDTNVVFELRKPKPHGAVVAWMSTLRPEQIFLSAVTIGELQAGAEELTRKHDVAKALEIETWLTWIETSFSALPMDAACFREWARIMVGKSTQLMEAAMIAATARVHGLEVASRNERDFQHLQVKAFNPFRVEL